MSPIFQRLRARYRRSSGRTQPKDEEASNILELGDLARSSRSKRGDPRATKEANLSTTAVGMNEGGKFDAGMGLPHNGILVELGLEQRVHGL